MSGNLVELFNSRTEVTNSSAELLYLAFECEDEDEVIALAAEVSPTWYHYLIRRSIEITEQLANDKWKVTVRYEKPSVDDEEAPESTISFDTTGGNQHITQSKETVGTYGPNASSQLGGAIGYDGENVAGVDITVPMFSMQETHYFTDEELNWWAYYALTGMVNSDEFRGWQPGEVLFLGASGQKRGTDGKWEITFKFAASPNMQNIAVADIIVTEKFGWDYLWIQYGDDVDGTANVRIKKPVAAYVERVYDQAPFSTLGI